MHRPLQCTIDVYECRYTFSTLISLYSAEQLRVDYTMTLLTLACRQMDVLARTLQLRLSALCHCMAYGRAIWTLRHGASVVPLVKAQA